MVEICSHGGTKFCDKVAVIYLVGASGLVMPIRSCLAPIAEPAPPPSVHEPSPYAPHDKYCASVIGCVAPSGSHTIVPPEHQQGFLVPDAN